MDQMSVRAEDHVAGLKHEIHILKKERTARVDNADLAKFYLESGASGEGMAVAEKAMKVYEELKLTAGVGNACKSQVIEMGLIYKS